MMKNNSIFCAKPNLQPQYLNKKLKEIYAPILNIYFQMIQIASHFHTISLFTFKSSHQFPDLGS